MESPFPSRAELDPPEQTPHVCLLACSPHPDGSTDAAARLLEQALLSRGATVDRIRLRDTRSIPASAAAIVPHTRGIASLTGTTLRSCSGGWNTRTASS